MLGISIQFIFQEDQASERDYCNECGELIIGKKYVAMVQFGDASKGDIVPFNYQVCEECRGQTGDKNG